MIKNFIRNEDGATAIEYGLIVALVAIAIVVSLKSVATSLSEVFNYLQSILMSKP